MQLRILWLMSENTSSTIAIWSKEKRRSVKSILRLGIHTHTGFVSR